MLDPKCARFSQNLKIKSKLGAFKKEIHGFITTTMLYVIYVIANRYKTEDGSL